jgi:putative ABC transport system permease protein
MTVQISGNHEAFKRELLTNPLILDATESTQNPIQIGNASIPVWEGKPKDQKGVIYLLGVDHHTLDFYGIDIKEGRGFTGTDTVEARRYILNESAARAAGFDNPVGRSFGLIDDEPGTIIGIVKDFHFAPLTLNIEPLLIRLEKEEMGTLSLKIDPRSIGEVVSYVESLWKKINPGRILKYTFLDDILDRTYRSERRLGLLFGYFTALAIFIACLGLFGIISLTAEQKTKEIGIRKVLGASVADVSFLLIKGFLILLSISALIGWPAGWIIMNQWLRNFAFRTGITPVVFLVSGAAALGIALMTISARILKTAISNPIQSLRYE